MTFVFLAGSLISGLILCYSLIEILLPKIDSLYNQVSGFKYGFVNAFHALSNKNHGIFDSFFPTIYILTAIYAKSYQKTIAGWKGN